MKPNCFTRTHPPEREEDLLARAVEHVEPVVVAVFPLEDDGFPFGRHRPKFTIVKMGEAHNSDGAQEGHDSQDDERRCVGRLLGEVEREEYHHVGDKGPA